MGNLLFSPSGRINAAEFTRGAYVLIIFGVLIHLSQRVSLPLHSLLALAGLALIWCWIALCIKRFHDGGQSGWTCLVPIAIYIVGFFILSGVLPSLFAPEEQAQLNEVTQAAVENWDFTELMAASQELNAPIARKMALPNAVGFLCLRLFIVFITNKMAGHEPRNNKYGSPT